MRTLLFDGTKLKHLAWGLAIALLAWALQVAMRPWTGDRVPFLFFLPALTLVAALRGRGPAFVVLLTGAANELYQGPPHAVFALAQSEDVFAVCAFLVVGTFLIFYGGHLRLTSVRATLAEGRLALAQEGTGIGVFELDFEAQSAFASPSLCELLGQPVMAGPIPLERWLRALDPDHVDASRIAMEAHAARGELRYEREQRIAVKDGSERWLLHRVQIELSPSGSLATARGTSVDITSRKRAEQALQEINENLEQQVLQRTRERDRTWNNSQDLLLVVDARGVFRETNPAWGAVLGYEPAELIGHGHLEFIHADDLASSAAALVHASVGRLRPFENRLRCKDGSYRWISWVAAPEGGLIYASGRDVTSAKHAAAELETTLQQLRQSQKMEAVGQLTGGVAHDFNNLLQVIGGNLQLLSREVAGIDGAERRLNSALAATRRGAKLAHQMLAFSRRQPLEPRIVDVGRLLLAMDDLFRRALGGAIEIDITVAEDLWTARVDAGQLENAILNLAINARDAMEGAGRLRIDARNVVAAAGGATFAPEGPAGRVSIAVSDTGHGMTREVMERVFEPFYSTKPVGQGTGLGLSMVDGFIRQSGGEIRLDSEVGRGTTVTLLLPRCEQPEPAEAAVELPAVEGGCATVLVAEDDPAVREIVVEMLRELGYAVVTAVDAAGALRVLESGLSVDLLLTDVVMPGPMSSVALAQKASALQPGLPILFTSGYMPESIVRDQQLDLVRKLLAKPFSRDELAAKVRLALAG